MTFTVIKNGIRSMWIFIIFYYCNMTFIISEFKIKVVVVPMIITRRGNGTASKEVVSSCPYLKFLTVICSREMHNMVRFKIKKGKY